MHETYNWTCDVESDFGGRDPNIRGIFKGLPIILETFKKHNVKGLFFISTELLESIQKEVRQIRSAGHEVGSHGHFHVVYKHRWRAEQDFRLSNTLLPTKYYRSPKFSWSVDDCIYSNRANHQGLLKMMWFKQTPNPESIFYLHPFDIVGANDPPNLFCKLWYSRPKKACELFKNLVEKFPGEMKLK